MADAPPIKTSTQIRTFIETFDSFAYSEDSVEVLRDVAMELLTTCERL